MRKHITIIFFVFISIIEFKAQHLTHEIGAFFGSTSLQTDYGQKGNFATQWNNNAKTFSVAHYLSFYNNTIRWDPHDVLHNHLMVKTEIQYLNNADYKHHGKWAKGNSYAGEQLRAMKGSIRSLDLGVNAEYFLFPLEEFIYPYSDILFNPFFTLGLKYSFFTNTLTSDLGDWRQDISVLPTKYQLDNALDIGDGQAVALSFGIGTRFKLSPKIDLVAQSTYQHFFSDTIDGLQTPANLNQNNDWSFNIQFGMVYHLNYEKPLFH